MDKKNIGIFHYLVGGTDGVSLEIDKWKLLLENLGHTVHLIGGELGAVEGILVKEMYHHLPESIRLNKNTFQRLSDFDPDGYKTELGQMTEHLVERFQKVVQDNQIDLILAENVWCVAANPAVALALEIIRQEFKLPAVAHHHDFYWEKQGGFSLTCEAAVELADKFLPPRDPAIKHTVINSLAQKELKDRKGIKSIVVPNVFDFSSPAWTIDEYNKDLRDQVGLGENDLVLLQATRIVTRKGIELAIDFTRALQSPDRRKTLMNKGLYDGRPFTPDSRIVLLLTGYVLDDFTGTYKENLIRKAEHGDVELVFIEDRVSANRTEGGKEKIYSLWDTYTAADLVTYPSLWEGWGNQLLEAVKAKLPLIIFEYPVYKKDIKIKGFKTISLGDTIRDFDENGLARIEKDILESAADQAVEMLTNNELRNEVIDHNFQVAKRYFSLESLEDYLEPLFSE